MMLAWLPLALAATGIFMLGWFAGRSTAAGQGRFGSLPASHPLPELGPAIRAEIEAAIADGHKIDAIKLLRDATGMGLKESKDAVEAMENLRAG